MLCDLFDDENAGRLTDAALVNRLAGRELELAAETVRAEGWKWIEVIPDLDWESLKRFTEAEPVRSPPTAEQQKQIGGGDAHPCRAWRGTGRRRGARPLR